MIADLLPLTLFPTGSLDSSVITTVWVGVMVVAFFNMRFGWSLAGLVVPGYLVPLLLIKPWSVAVILLEGMVTYLLVRGLSSAGGRWFGLADFFGRDRFFALVLVSVLVRLIFDAFWLPGLGRWLNDELGLHFDYLGNLHSFGLVIVALIANNFWKPGLVRGTGWLLTTLLLTFVLVRFGLMELTNFSASNLSYLYEDIASSLLASPKAYIILLTTAFIASRLNLHYAWEFNGILIPSLLALQWYQPAKLLTTFVEVGVILVVVRLLLALPWLANLNLTGARKLMLFFNVAFAYKLLLGLVLQTYFPHVKATDYFAFGYLIATLLAVKIHDKDIGVRVTRATLQTSLMAGLAASVVGFALTLLPLRLETVRQDDKIEYRLPETEQTLAALLRRQKVEDYGAYESLWRPQPSGLELSHFHDALEYLQEYRRRHAPRLLRLAQQSLAALAYEVVRVEGHFLVVRAREADPGWGTFVLDIRRPVGLQIAVPESVREQGMAEVGLALFKRQQASTLALGGTGGGLDTALPGGVTAAPGSLFHQFHQVFGRNNSVQVRRINRHATRQLQRLLARAGAPLRRTNYLLVKQALPPGLQLASLQQGLEQVVVHWGEIGRHNVQRLSADTGFAELYIQPDSARLLLARVLRSSVESEPVQVRQDRLEHYLQPDVPPTSVQAFQPPRLNQLIFADHEVLAPLLRRVRGGGADDRLLWPAQLRYLNDQAGSIGYRIVQLRSAEGRFLVLQPQASGSRDWGTLVLNLDRPDAPHVVQVPRPLAEHNTLAAGLKMFTGLDARALMVASRVRQPDPLQAANVLKPSNRDTLFNLMHQVLLREAHDEPITLVQLRGMRDSQEPRAPVVLAYPVEEGNAAGLEDVRSLLARAGIPYQMADEAATGADYRAERDALSRYLPAAHHASLALVWVAADIRRTFAGGAQTRRVQQYQALGISRRQLLMDASELQPGTAALPAAVVRLLSHYAQSEDILALVQLMREGWALEHLESVDGRHALLLISGTPGGKPVRALIRPDALNMKVVQAGQLSSASLQDFLEQNALILQLGGEA
ncbi:poly-gamma-glutamate biosynthesis protein PgsC/CapC [Marinobacterium weihaiense]|uniref:Poly-gamma-glutamate biosynthesis protein PgsC/CapC n=1 Tax=Marinobacterium weihaiense TaxID=2851016 RepID=A0ABS6MFJ8_9GAMM|nr:poly-gamma-glutamate biosynthesis protein PgsC/CapC [Marinobacterium weihaiense]MBV0934487.1 poly-gamma-glutamate biosynthesis protein PgsC/CapC [Marinobacterium weihaiense]